MRYLLLYLILQHTLGCIPSSGQTHNRLTAAEKQQGWELLFDGKTTTGWRGAYNTPFPEKGWVVRNGELRGELAEGAESGDAGDLVTEKKYRNFQLRFDWKIGKGGNSGVKYFVEERHPKPEKGSLIGYEYQLIDDANYIYEGKKLPQDLKTASIYDVIAADKPDVTMDTWHTSQVIVDGSRIEHWLDGKKVLETRRDTKAFTDGVADSKFHNHPGFATIPEGHILLQDHGHTVSFRNIKIKTL